jgi:two-component system, OmpR family, sensor histidine kinase PhoQ
VFRGDEGDLQEILGNLLDNAWKYARSEVRCSASAAPGGALVLRVEDDGEGLDPARAAEALARGTRLDESLPGQGIGLAVVKELAAAYVGGVEVERSALGGAAVTVRLFAAKA